MRRRTFYTIALLLPAAALALIVPVAGPPMQMGPPLGLGGTEVWLSPLCSPRARGLLPGGRMVVRLAMGYAYIGLVELVRTRLLEIELTDEA